MLYQSIRQKKRVEPQNIAGCISWFFITGNYGICMGNYGICMGFLRVFDFQDLLKYGRCMGRIWDFTGRIWDFMGRIWDILTFDLKKSIYSIMGTEKTGSFQHSIPKFDSAAGQTFLGSRKILKFIRTWDGFPPMLWQVQTWPQPQIGNHLWQSSLLEQALIILPSCLHGRDTSWHWGWVWVPSATVHQVIPQANNSLPKRSRVNPKPGHWGITNLPFKINGGSNTCVEPYFPDSTFSKPRVRKKYLEHH